MMVLRRAALFAVVFAVSIQSIGLGGVQQDPNAGDDVLGIAGGLRYSSDATAFDVVSGSAFAEAGCGGPLWHLIGGGSRAGGPPDQAWHSAGRPIDFTDADDAGDDGWYSGAQGPSSAELTSYAICIRDQTLLYRSKSVPDSPSGLRSGSTNCGAERWHVTTGSTFIQTTGSWTNASYPSDDDDPGRAPDDAWAGRVFDTLGGTGGFSMYQVCVRGVMPRYVRDMSVVVGTGTSEVRRVGCRASEHVVGGGARLSGPADEGRLLATLPYDGGDRDSVPDDGWQSRVYNISGLDKGLTAYAICLG